MTEYTAFPEIGSYPNPKEKTSLAEWATEVTRQREQDKTKWRNLKEVVVRGRLRNNLRSTPSSSADVTATDNENDVMWDASYLYILVNNAGSLVWRRVGLSSW